MAVCAADVLVCALLVSAGASVALPRTGGAFRRQVSVELNPGLTPPSTLPPGVGVVHVRALGLNDTLHLLLCNAGAPALLLVHSDSTQSAPRLDWPEFINRSAAGSLRVEPESSVRYSSALVFTRLWEYEDLNNTADPEKTAPSGFYPPYQLQDFTWSEPNVSVAQSDHTVTLCGGARAESFLNGSLCLRLSVFESDGRDGAWPSLLHNANSSQLRVWLDGVTPRGNDSRFALEFQSVTDSGFQSRVDVRSSIDDEYTPSIFKVSEWVSLRVNGSAGVWGFTQWKPVAYRRPEPVFEDAAFCRHSELVSVASVPPSALVQAYFTEPPHTYGLNISFGMAGDAFYNATRFISWTVLVGLGEPPTDSFSTLIIIIIAVGLGSPLAIIVFGGVFVWSRKRAAQSGYEPIN